MKISVHSEISIDKFSFNILGTSVFCGIFNLLIPVFQSIIEVLPNRIGKILVLHEVKPAIKFY